MISVFGKVSKSYNIEFFGTPLPLVLQPNENMGSETINKFRIQLLLWVLYSELTLELVLSPTHIDLRKLSAMITAFLEKRFKDMPRCSSVKEFFSGPNHFAWEIKRKLVWLGTHSYFFRNSFRNYVENNGGKLEIPEFDDTVYAVVWNGENVILRSTISEIKGLSFLLSELFKTELNPQKRRTLHRISQMLENIDIQWSANCIVFGF